MNAERDLGPQPLAALLERHQLRPTDLVQASGEQLTHKMVARALKGRRLTRNTAEKVLRALNSSILRPDGETVAYRMDELFNYPI
jgi:aspartokinase